MGLLKFTGKILLGTAYLTGKTAVATGKLAAKGTFITAKAVYNHREGIGQVVGKTAKVAGTAAAIVGYGGYKAAEWGVKKVVDHRHEIGGAVYGAASGTSAAIADASGHVFAREDRIKPLVERLAEQSAEYRECVSVLYRRLENIPPRVSKRDVYLDTLTVGGETLASYAAFAVAVPEDVERAYQLAYPGLAANADFAETVRRMSSPDELQGLASGVKGKLFEIEYADYLNAGNLPTGYQAELATSATQPGWDIQILGPDGHMKDVIQLKATDSIDYVREALDRYPHIDVVTTSEVQGQLLMRGLSEHVTNSGISDSALQQVISDTTDGAALQFDWMPSALSLALIAFTAYSKDGLDAYEKSRNFGERASKTYLAYLAGGALAVATNTWWLGVLGGMGTRFIIESGKAKRERLASLQILIRANNQTLARIR
ncbi:MAG: hypothetical protein CO125_11440 [Hydrogenophilales bacterium CG_4_9_14_3_um_filter_59_35]|nr:MAG: hypothetical protein COW70_02865 [Hydrogenophilales bacterium CG18_big_fil_WC_8_21_14_2_50_58_12]PIY01251.1 MAG: hypothetical protein COZ23_04120 [Hydrogenophilales bacterium CG_4_10_14_3_um_filter_58_23]PJB04468.1 MAG: hypothetical protein CO125_11440 [Hydrogenophilales bacterium CG_4_9_14_3_um_filter_59_35]